ncbi:hypothetical protein CJ255_05185 [Candidatus Viridilinea mediisalina]|uniref:Uncharacterized protein n=1 Tax=Candidatus Viridilinea mediisalina TaxID=2024553 RepID=A0A2A6RME4_9CHLR|nr:hypothetical protein CJ255_05185 [Candidatus Viridilinea mediisalina]
MYSCDAVKIESSQILDKVNSTCSPPISDLSLERITIDNHMLIVITIPPSPYLHETTKKIETKKAPYNEGTVFIRRGESISNATQEERDAIRREKQRVFGENRVMDLLERRISMTEQRIEQLQVDITEQRYRGEVSDFSIIEDDIKIEKLTLDYLKSKRIFRQQNTRSGKRFYDYAVKLIEEKIPNIIKFLASNSMNTNGLIDEIYQDAEDAIRKAFELGFIRPRGYLYLMRFYDFKQQMREAYDCGCDALEIDHHILDLYRFHLQICWSIYDLYEDDREDVMHYINLNKQNICRILGVTEVDDRGEPILDAIEFNL